MSPLVGLLRPYRWSLARALVAAIVTAVPGLMTAVLMGYIVDAVQSGSGPEVIRAAVLLIAMAIIGALLWVPRAVWVTHAAVDAEAAIRTSIFERILRADLGTLATMESGQVVSRSTADLRIIRSFISSSLPAIGSVVAGYAFLVITAGYHHPLLGLLTLVPVALVLLLSLLRVHRDVRDPLTSRHLLGQATTVIDETLAGIDMVRADDRRDRAFDAVAALIDGARRALSPVLRRNAAFTAVLTMVPYLAYAGVLGLGVVLIRRDPGFAVGELVTISLLMLHVAGPTTGLGGVISGGQSASAAAERINEVLCWPDAQLPVRQSGSDIGARGLGVGMGDDACLRDIELSVGPSEAVGILGSSASGKSTLLQALHGIRSDITGTITGPPRTVLVSGDDVVFPATVREAVSYGQSDATDARIELAAAQAGLTEVVDQLANGWSTQIGGATGTRLSGGQMQRVRLARGLLIDGDALLLDAVSVGLDAQTNAQVNAGIHAERRGRPLVTAANHPTSLGPVTVVRALADGTLHDATPAGAGFGAAEAQAAGASPAPSSTAGSTPQPATTAPPAAGDPGQQRRARAAKRTAGRRRIRLVASLMRPDAGWIGLAIVTVVLSTLCTLVPIYLGLLVVVDLASPDGLRRLPVIIGALVLTALLIGVALLASGFLIPWIGQRGLARLRLKAFRALLDVHLAYFDRQNVGAIVSRLTNNIELLDDVINGAARTMITAVAMLTTVSVLLILLDAELALIAYAIVPIIILLIWGLGRGQRWALQRNVAGISDVTVAIRDAVRGAATIRSFGTEQSHREHFERVNEYERTALLRSAYVFKVFAAAMQFVVAIDVALVVWSGSQRALAGALAVTTMVLFATYIQHGLSPISTIATVQATYGQSGVAMDQIIRMVDLHPDPQLASTRIPDRMPTNVAELEFEDVWFAYSKAGWVLTKASLAMNRGEHVAIVGKTGGGKSSLVKLALRFYSPIRGTVRIHGTPISDVQEAWLRQQVAYVPQEPSIHSGTLRANLTAGRDDATDAQVLQVIADLGLTDGLLGDLGGLDAAIGSGARMPSAGQRQLIALIRALLANRPILIMDEATSHMDPLTEASVMRALRNLRPELTVVSIAHHLELARSADRVAVVAQRTIAEQGTHDELLRSGGTYARLWAAYGASQPG